MNKLSIVLLMLLAAFVHPLCQTSQYQALLAKMEVGSLTTNTAALSTVMIIEDGDDSRYHIGKIGSGANSGMFVRKIDSSDVEQWVWTKPTDGYPLMGGTFISYDETKLVIATTTDSTNHYYAHLELSTSDGSLIANHQTIYKILGSPNEDTVQMAVPPSKDYMFFGADAGVGLTELALVRVTFLNPVAAYDSIMVLNNGDFAMYALVAKSDMSVVIAGSCQDTAADDATCIVKVSWSSDPPGKIWERRFKDSLGSPNKVMRLTPNSDFSTYIHAGPVDGNKLVLHTFTDQAGTFESVKVITGFTSQADISDLLLYSDSKVLIAKSNVVGSDQSILLVYDLDTDTLDVYERTNIYFRGFGKDLSGSRVLIGAGDSSTNEFLVIESYSPTPFYLLNIFSSVSGYAIADTTDYPDNVGIEYVSSYYSRSQNAMTTVSTAEMGTDTVASSSSDSMIWNFWGYTTITAETSVVAGTLDPEHSCLVSSNVFNTPAVTYTLDDGGGSIPTWVSLDSSTSELTYDSPSTPGNYMFGINAEIAGFTNPFYTDITFSITEPTSGGGSSGGGSSGGGSSGGGSSGGSSSGGSSSGGSSSGGGSSGGSSSGGGSSGGSSSGGDSSGAGSSGGGSSGGQNNSSEGQNSSTEEKDDDHCLGGDSKGQCAGFIIAIIVGVLVAIGVIVALLFIINKFAISKSVSSSLPAIQSETDQVHPITNEQKT